MGPGDLARVLTPLRDYLATAEPEPNLLVGLDVADDAAVYRLSDELALIQTVDFFTPIVDDPHDFGAIAAANAMSDVYAMGGEVLLALNIGGFPEDLPAALVGQIFLGAAEKVHEAGARVAGGHTVNDAEPKFGLVVTGTVHPERILTVGGARPGDRLILTKPLGSGIIATAARADRLSDPAHLQAAVRAMTTLNRGAARALDGREVHAVTDVTGFGLLGHAAEMALASGVAFRIEAASLPLMAGAQEYAAAGLVTGGAGRNRGFFDRVRVAPEVSLTLQRIAWDPQTSGGLLIALPAAGVPALLDALQARGVRGFPVGEVLEGEGIEVVTG